MRQQLVILAAAALIVLPAAVASAASRGGVADRRFPERGSSATLYGGSSADRYGGTSADRGGTAGPRDRRVYGNRNFKQNDVPRRTRDDDEAQDREEE